MPTDTNKAIALKVKLSTKALKIDNFSFQISCLNDLGPLNLVPTVENLLADSVFPKDGPLHSASIKSDQFAVASSSLQELQKFAYKFNTQLFTQKRQFKI